MSFALTSEQILNKSKIVTRRLGWKFLKPGDLVQPVKKGMGLKKGEKIEKLGSPIRIIDVRPERLRRMIDETDYGFDECQKEGFENHPELQWPSYFVDFFCRTHKGCTLDREITRVEFEYPENADNL